MKITIQDDVTPELKQLMDGLRNRKPLLRSMGGRVRLSISQHLAARSLQVRNKLGAPSSDFWGKAAEATSRAPVTPEQSSVSIALNHPGIARAFGPLTIRPTTGLYLTIPLHAQAYNKRAYRIKGLFFFKSKKGNAFLAESIGGGGVRRRLQLWYLLKTEVHQDQDRSILPSDEQIEQAALQGADDYLTRLIERRKP